MTWQRRRQAVLGVINWMAQRGEAHYRRHLERFAADGTGVGPILRLAEQRHEFMTPEQIRKFANGNAIDFGSKVARIAPPRDKTSNAVALLHCHWIVDNGYRQCRFYYGLWERMTTHPDISHPASVIVFSAHRLEIPEIGDNHNYHHTQYCTSIGPNGSPEPREAIKLSTLYPAWPIAAEDEVQLALCLVIALYGFIGLREFEDDIRTINTFRSHDILDAALVRAKALQMAH